LLDSGAPEYRRIVSADVVPNNRGSLPSAAVANRSKSLGARMRDKPLTNATTGIAVCCARATTGHVAAPPRSVRTSRRFTQ
jgi:hypothetical protein